MGSITNDSKQTVVTFEVERLLDEPIRMMRNGKFMVAKNVTMGDAIGWVLWSLVGHKAPAIDLNKIKSIQVSYNRDAGTFVATMEKQR
jgi:hypothetical protein